MTSNTSEEFAIEQKKCQVAITNFGIDHNKVDHPHSFKCQFDGKCKNCNLQNVHTPFDLSSQIVGKLKEFAGNLENKDILVFNLEIVEVLVYEYGVSKERIWFLSDCLAKLGLCSILYKGVTPVNKDFFDFLNDKKQPRKFDVIIGNPPYQDSIAKSSKKLWDKFLKKALEITKEGGNIAFVTPFSWATPENSIFNVFQENQVEYINLDGKVFFPDVGTTISWYIMSKCPTTHQATIVYDGEVINIDLRSVDFLPSSLHPLVFSILKKMFDQKQKLDINYDYSCEQRKPTISKENKIPFIYPIKHTATQELYSSVPHPNMETKKVMFPISSAMKAEYDGEGKYGCSQHYAWIPVKSEEEAQMVIAYLHSKTIRFLRKVTHWTASWSRPILDKIPAISLDKVMSDEEIYDYFGFSKEERKYIETV